MSDDPQQEYFADGIVEDIITALCHIRWLFVIARNSSFAYKGRAVDVKQVGRELGVRYVLEGSVRKAATTGAHHGAADRRATGAHLWADHFDGDLEDIFDLQDQVTASVVGAIAPKLEQAEIERAKRKPTESLDAYDYFLRGLASTHRMTREATDGGAGAVRQGDRARSRFRFALWRGGVLLRRAQDQRLDDRSGRARGRRSRAAGLAGGGAWARTMPSRFPSAGLALGYVVGDLDGAVALIDRALALNPNLASGVVRQRHGAGVSRRRAGRGDRASRRARCA